MTVVEIRITDRTEADGIGADGTGTWIVLARSTRPAAREVVRFATEARPDGTALDFVGWHARLAGVTARA